MRRKSNCGSSGGAALFTAFRYSSSGRVDARRSSLPSRFKTLFASAQDKTPTVIVSATSSNRDFMVVSFLNTYAVATHKCIYIYYGQKKSRVCRGGCYFRNR